MSYMVPPTDQPFIITMACLPHGFIEVSPDDIKWFESAVNSDIRYYYRMIRNKLIIKDHNPVGVSGITAGELALYLIRENHTKRQRRY
jgi:hypothetical protein